MNGLLWFYGAQKRSLTEQVRMGISHYAKKYGKQAELCLVCPQDFETLIDEAQKQNEGKPVNDLFMDSVRVRPYSFCLKNHALIGAEEDVRKQTQQAVA